MTPVVSFTKYSSLPEVSSPFYDRGFRRTVDLFLLNIVLVVQDQPPLRTVLSLEQQHIRLSYPTIR